MCESGLDAGCLGKPGCRAQLQVTYSACLCSPQMWGCCVKRQELSSLLSGGSTREGRPPPPLWCHQMCARPQRVTCAQSALDTAQSILQAYLISSVSLLRNKILTVWIACLRSRAIILVKTKQLCISNRMQIFLCSFKNSDITPGDRDSLHGFPSVAVSDVKWFCCIYWPVCARITGTPPFLNVAAVYLDEGVFKIRHWEVSDISYCLPRAR